MAVRVVSPASSKSGLGTGADPHRPDLPNADEKFCGVVKVRSAFEIGVCERLAVIHYKHEDTDLKLERWSVGKYRLS